ncbi:MAG: hypothetical protein CMO80_11060 [Verrucomicrobiales bacterium]|nr:hypothetical protein [Verrucomicrobiales bacterium]
MLDSNDGKGWEFEEIIESKLESCRENLWRLRYNVLLAAVLVLIGILMIRSSESDMLVPVVNQPVSRRVLCYILPMIAFYTWIGFGYNLNDLIHMRMAAVRPIEASEPYVTLKDNGFKPYMIHYTRHPYPRLRRSGNLGCLVHVV